MSDSMLMVKKWIFEHACKYVMNDVMQAIFQKSGNKSLSQLNDDVSFIKPNPAFMFVTLVEIFHETLRTEDMSWDNTLLTMITEILEDIYKKNNFVPIKRFMNAITRLKLMELLKLMAEGTHSSDVVRRVNVHFPRWNKDTQNMIRKEFKISSLTSLKKTEKTIVACRRFILGLLVSKDKWKNYQQNNYSIDMKQFAETVKKELVEMMNVLRPELPPSPIEQVLNGAKEDLANSDDAAIQILLEHLHVGMNEADFLRLLEILDPETESQINPKPFACVLDCISETSIAGDIKNTSDEASDTSTIVFIDDLSEKGTDLPEILLQEGSRHEDPHKHGVVFLDDSPTEKVSALSLRSCEEIQKSFNDPKENEKEQNRKIHEIRTRGRPCKKSRPPQIIVACSEGNSDDSEIETLPDLGCHLVQECVKPCMVKLHEHMVIKADSIKYQIYS